jgi:hypothetical protein
MYAPQGSTEKEMIRLNDWPIDSATAPRIPASRLPSMEGSTFMLRPFLATAILALVATPGGTGYLQFRGEEPPACGVWHPWRCLCRLHNFRSLQNQRHDIVEYRKVFFYACR